MTAGARARRARIVLVAAVLLLAVVVVASLALGARAVAPDEVLRALVAYDPLDPDQYVVVTQRVPRTVIGVVAGAALAVAGTLMQGLTRNPLADPGLLGVNGGASVAVLCAIVVFGLTSPTAFVWFAFAGAAIAAVVVGVIGSRGADGANPAKLALTGAAVTAALTAVSTLILTTSIRAFDVFRFWQVGGLTSRGLGTVLAVAAPIAVGILIALVCARGLDLIALGDETASGLGHRVGRTRLAGTVAAVLLCGGATAIAGPIVFVGLLVPHALRALVGGDHLRLLAIALPAGAALLVLADIVGRFLAPPGEVQAGLVVAFVGAPLLIALVLRRGRVAL